MTVGRMFVVAFVWVHVDDQLLLHDLRSVDVSDRRSFPQAKGVWKAVVDEKMVTVGLTNIVLKRKMGL